MKILNTNKINKQDIKFTYMIQPPRKYTFEQPKLREYIEKHCTGEVLNLFAGKTKLNVNETRVDISNEFKPDYNMEAFEFIKYCINDAIYFDTIILDPPYSIRKSMEKYNGKICSTFNKIIQQIPFILRTNGKVISLGYNTIVMGKKRGFSLSHVCIIAHGGGHHDTICAIEEKNTNSNT